MGKWSLISGKYIYSNTRLESIIVQWAFCIKNEFNDENIQGKKLTHITQWILKLAKRK
jgi:hypothetical protein